MEAVRLSVTRDAAVRFEVIARPRARTSRIAGIRRGALVVDLASPPVDGAANTELLETVAGVLSVPRATLTLARGGASRVKLLEVRGLTVDRVRELLARATPAPRA